VVQDEARGAKFWPWGKTYSAIGTLSTVMILAGKWHVLEIVKRLFWLLYKDIICL
jgi:hypothetical protein